MALKIRGVPYLTSSELLQELGISRQTLWRWQREGRVPPGSRLRNRRLYSAEDAEAIRDYASQVEPAQLQVAEQLALFGAQTKGTK